MPDTLITINNANIEELVATGVLVSSERRSMGPCASVAPFPRKLIWTESYGFTVCCNEGGCRPRIVWQILNAYDIEMERGEPGYWTIPDP